MKKQSTKGGMIISWKNEENVKHYGISINNVHNDFEICNTIGYQFILLDKEYEYDENEVLFVITSKSTPGYGEIIKEDSITDENKSRIIGKFETSRGFIFSKSELPEYLHSSWSSGDIYGIVHLFDTVSGMKESIKFNHDAILQGDFIKYIDPVYFNIFENLYPDSCSSIELYKKVLELENKSSNKLEEKLIEIRSSSNDTEEKLQKEMETRNGEETDEDSLEKMIEAYLKASQTKKIQKVIVPNCFSGDIINQNVEDWLNEQYLVPTAGPEEHQYESE